MANSTPEAKKSWELDVLELEGVEDGGVSPWFSSWGNATMAWLTTEPSDADAFAEVAKDPSLGNLYTYFDTEQPALGRVSLACYVLLGIVILCALVVLPLCCMRALRSKKMKRCTATTLFIIGEILLLMGAFFAMACLYSLVRTWFSIVDTLVSAAPQAYTWAMQLLRNYTNATVSDLKRAVPKSTNTSTADRDVWVKQVDEAGHDTLAGISWLEENLTAWEDRHGAYASNRRFMAGWPLVPMIALGLAIGLATAAGLLACVVFPERDRYRTAEDDEDEPGSSPSGRKARRGRTLSPCGPKSLARLLLLAAVTLIVYLLAALPMISIELPPCVLLAAYACAPYRAGRLTILDDGVARAWPPVNRPDPFCRLVPSVLLDKCSSQGQRSITALPRCASPNTTKEDSASHSRHVQSIAFVREKLSQQDPFQRAAGNATESENKTIVVGDCYYPATVVSTSMDAACPLFTDDLVAHWMALTAGALCALLSLIGAFLLAYLFFSGHKRSKKSWKTVKRRKKTRRKREQKKGNKRETPQPSLPALRPLIMLLPPPPPPTHIMMHPTAPVINIAPMPPPIPKPIPYLVPIPTRRGSRARRTLLMPPAPMPVVSPAPMPAGAPAPMPASTSTDACSSSSSDSCSSSSSDSCSSTTSNNPISRPDNGALDTADSDITLRVIWTSFKD